MVLRIKILLLFIGLIFFRSNTSFSQTENYNVPDSVIWEHITSFRLYDMGSVPREKAFEALNESEKKKLNYVEVNLKEAKNVLKKTTTLGHTTASFSGMQYAIVQFGGNEKVMLKMNFLGFQNTINKKYYVFSNENSFLWERFYSKYLNKTMVINKN